MLNQTDLIKLSKGDQVDHFLLVKKSELKTGKTQKQYLSLELGDRSLSLQAFMWDDFYNVFLDVKPGSIVKVKGAIEEYQNQLQLKVNKINTACSLDDISIEDFLPVSKRNFEQMKNELEDRISNISNKYLKQLLSEMLTGSHYEKYLNVPAGKAWHHSYVHGLLEHTLEIVAVCDLVCGFHPEANRDLLIAGAILHDFGKTEELSIESAFDYTDKGRLLGHISIAALLVNDKINLIENFPDQLKTELMHLILSHQGKLEQASPVEPKTLEAIILYHADELSAKANAYKSAIAAEAKNESGWTKFLPLINTPLFITDKFKNE